MTGDLELESITIDPDAVDPEDVEMLQDMVLAAVNEALRSRRRSSAGRARWAALDRAASAASGWRPRRRWACPAALHAAAMCSLAPRPAPRHRAGQAARHRQPHRAAARVPPAARARRRTRTRSPTRSATSRSRSALCEVCFNLAEGPRCAICQDERRDPALICVVEEPGDVIPIERTHEYRGRYHVLGGALSPIDGVEPEDLKIAELYARVAATATVREVVLATNPTTTGEATALHIADGLRERAPRRRGHAARVRPAGRRRPRVRRRGHARPALAGRRAL